MTPRTAPWKRAAPKSPAAKGTKLTPKYRARAKAAAKRAGRRYPNLVDNMAAARQQREDESKTAAPKSLRSAQARPKPRTDHP